MVAASLEVDGREPDRKEPAVNNGKGPFACLTPPNSTPSLTHVNQDLSLTPGDAYFNLLWKSL